MCRIDLVSDLCGDTWGEDMLTSSPFPGRKRTHNLPNRIPTNFPSMSTGCSKGIASDLIAESVINDDVYACVVVDSCKVAKGRLDELDAYPR